MGRRRPKKQTSGLGRTLKRDRNQRQKKELSDRHSEDVKEAPNRLQSIIEENDLEAFLTYAELSRKDFTAEKEHVTLIVNDMPTTFDMSGRELKKKRDRDEILLDYPIPRRPKWTKDMTPQELHEKERQAFLEWRRKLAAIEEKSDDVITPYEKNLNVWRQLWRVIERCAICVQIVDARNPLLFRCTDLEKYVKEVDPMKLNVLLLNKADLLTKKQRFKWAQYFKNIGVEMIFFSAHREQEKINKEDTKKPKEEPNKETETPKEIKWINPADKDWTHIFTREELLDYFHYLINKDEKLKKHFIRPLPKEQQTTHEYKDGGRLCVGMVGYPNVGKSSIINVLCGTKKVAVAPTPGKTKHFQTLPIDKNIMLCDCPGLVFPSVTTTKAEMVCDGILPIDQMREHRPPIAIVVQRIPKRVFELTYGITFPPTEDDEYLTVDELLDNFAKHRGFMSHKGNPNQPMAARIILKDYVNGKLIYCHPPPIDKTKGEEEEEEEVEEIIDESEALDEEYFTESEDEEEDEKLGIEKAFNVWNVNEVKLMQKEMKLRKKKKQLPMEKPARNN